MVARCLGVPPCQILASLTTQVPCGKGAKVERKISRQTKTEAQIQTETHSNAHSKRHYDA